MQISNIEYHKPLDTSDHCVITFNYECYIDFTKPVKRNAYDKADYDKIRRHLTTSDWKEKLMLNTNHISANQLWTRFKDEVHKLTERFVP